jgi:hypothetical protein
VSSSSHEPSSFSIPTPIPHDHAFQSRRSHAQIFFPSLGHDRALIHLPFITSLGSVPGVPIPSARPGLAGRLRAQLSVTQPGCSGSRTDIWPITTNKSVKSFQSDCSSALTIAHGVAGSPGSTRPASSHPQCIAPTTDTNREAKPSPTHYSAVIGVAAERKVVKLLTLGCSAVLGIC